MITNDSTTYVTIGKIELGHSGVSLVAILGSCVGIAIFCERNSYYALAHCLLATRIHEFDPDLPGRLVPYAIPKMVEMLEDSGVETKHMSGCVVGGANLIGHSSTSAEKGVGAQNIAAAIKGLAGLSIPIVYEDTGGTYGRKLEIDCATGSISSQKIINFQKA